MELKLDRNKTYGLALEGGGAKGAYQIGAWKALREAGIRFSAVSGTSVGALNGAMIVMDDLEKAENVWNNIHFSQVMDVDDEEMRRLMNRDIPLSELKSTLRSVADIVRNRGFDVTPQSRSVRRRSSSAGRRPQCTVRRAAAPAFAASAHRAPCV